MTSLPPTPQLPDSFFAPVLTLNEDNLKVRWYMIVIVNLGSLNYADVIPQVYAHLEGHLLSHLSSKDQYDAIHKIREGLTKAFGIVGAARTGNALRTLFTCTPEHLQLKSSPRSMESEEVAIKRGDKFFHRAYDGNPYFKASDTEEASPDYFFLVKDIVYGRIFSYDGILDDTTSAFAMVSALYGMNSPGQMRNHQIGMLLNGVDREELIQMRKLLLQLASTLGVAFRFEPPTVPCLPLK
ncbi:unnamed protein product [Clonostachys rosea f. rosea IK726]|uniref:Uncharacterized protein n=2 Tax=Bionectria ochroleuca TaxID=29856 RepID=A0A0B7JUS4_BIOOC|nr:unnamed protein product [Clonostachys rosea f. rosea IK726]